MNHERLIKDLRMYANDSGYSHADYADVLTSAADEIERLDTRAPDPLRKAVEELLNELDFAIRGLTMQESAMLHFVAIGKLRFALSASPAQEEPRVAELLAQKKIEDAQHLSRIVELEAANKVLQAKIDALMLEYCPDEMTSEQVAEWRMHQKRTTDSIKPKGNVK